jgi:hypothetical protein
MSEGERKHEDDEREKPAGAAANEADDDEGSGRTAPFGWVSLVIIAVLVVGTWFLIQKLSEDTKMQDCIQSGRRNCAPIQDTRP